MSPRTLFGLVLLLTVAAAGPGVDAQQTPRIAKVGYLQATARGTVTHLVDAFRQGLRELGYVEGKSVLLEIRTAEGESERLPKLARELVDLKPDVIVATSDPAIAALKRETQTIPIVMAFSTDPRRDRVRGEPRPSRRQRHRAQ